MPVKKPQRPTRTRTAGQKVILFSLLIVLFGGGYWIFRSRSAGPAGKVASTSGQPTIPTASLPPYFESAEAAQPLPATLSPERFGNPVVRHAYRVAKGIPPVVAQQPCYCHCDKFGHRSLLDCFASDHGAG
jgi:hypothetical protein